MAHKTDGTSFNLRVQMVFFKYVLKNRAHESMFTMEL